MISPANAGTVESMDTLLQFTKLLTQPGALSKQIDDLRAATATAVEAHQKAVEAQAMAQQDHEKAEALFQKASDLYAGAVALDAEAKDTQKQNTEANRALHISAAQNKAHFSKWQDDLNDKIAYLDSERQRVQLMEVAANDKMEHALGLRDQSRKAIAEYEQKLAQLRAIAQ